MTDILGKFGLGENIRLRLGWRLLVNLHLWMAVTWTTLADQNHFDNANKLFEQGQYEQAIDHYQTLLESGTKTSAVHFNLGNAWFRQGNIGQAIYHYLMAQSIDPLDPDIRANLRFARDSAGLPAGGIVSPIYQWIQKAPLNVWAMLTLAPLWGYCLLKAVGFFRVKFAVKSQAAQNVTGWLTIPGLVLLALIAWMVKSHHPGVIIQDKAELHASPFADSKVLLEMKAGEEVLLMASKNQWQQVKNSNGDLGWVESVNLKSIPTQ